ARLYRDVDSLAIPDDGCLSLAARRGFLHEPCKLPDAANSLAVELDDDVSLLQAGSGRRAVVRDVLDNDASLCRRLSGFRIVVLDIADRDANLASASAEDLERAR